MRLLLDSHTLVWFLTDLARIPIRAREAILDDGTDVSLSMASLWELGIKASLGRLEMDLTFEQLLAEVARQHISLLRISPDDVRSISGMTGPHRDPFDRMLAAQSVRRKLTLVSRDSALDGYGVERLWQ